MKKEIIINAQGGILGRIAAFSAKQALLGKKVIIVTKKEIIHHFFQQMPASDSKYLRLTYAELVPNIEFKQFITCEECNVSQEVNVPFGASFFWFK